MLRSVEVFYCYSIDTVVSSLLSLCVVSEFLEFVASQELCRKQWLNTEQQCAELSATYSELQRDNEALDTKLKHARSVSLHDIPFENFNICDLK